ncbi:hypothetical protein [Actinomadura rugatobispora]|uniref:Spore-associated protein A n=1 Tax=Actinomadura rugatobispora TaxID=1994 RepID=A0ABW1AAC8_9ACTN
MLAILASAGVASAALVVGASPASAAGPCGSGYSRVGVYAIPENGTRKGTLEVYYSSGAKKNCALTYGYGAWANTENWKSVGIRRSATGITPWDHDYGDSTYYAGPVYVSAPGACIDVIGGVDGAGIDLYDVHCG